MGSNKKGKREREKEKEKKATRINIYSNIWAVTFNAFIYLNCLNVSN